MHKMVNNTSKENIKLRSEEVQEILSNPPSWIVRWGITLIFMFTIIILTLSFIIKYPDFLIAKVIITTEEPMEHVVARQSGPLEYLYVKNGDTVVPGQRLAMIRNTARIGDVDYLKTILDTILSVSKKFTFPIESSSNLVLGDIETAYINFEKSYVDFRLFQDLNPHANQLSGNRQSLLEIKLRLKDQIKQKGLMEDEYNLMKIDYQRYSLLYDKGVISQQEFEAKKIDFLQKQKNLSAMAISISQIREAITSTNHLLKSTRINQQEDDARFLASLSQNYNALKKAIKDWEYNYVLTSSTKGVIGFQEFWGENQFVDARETVFSILPTNSPSLVGKLVLPSHNAGKVISKQKVIVKLDNFPYQEYGVLVGEVSNISVSPDKEGNYFVYISLPEGMKTSYNRKLSFEQELLGIAEIITEDLSVAERIFYKLRDLLKYY